MDIFRERGNPIVPVVRRSLRKGRSEGGSMVRRTLVATLLGGLLLLGAPTVAFAGKGGSRPNGHMGSDSHMGNGGHISNGMGRAGMHRMDGRFDRDDRRFDRDDRRFRHHRFFFAYA